ncbi:flagellar brake domain-containing protein [Alkalihalophilus marmarensis]|jgi:c-di-GMP-binding flagellar brake protein YcgR|uniref:C-di-GMP-binding flagellar brake protein YcgR, contains PilZNR and PilZ domains n=1 Tax=Alkalihalophilus marmarensis DSM 21297 TaxID=1188261 RepID=U6SRA5_9BACI|nr:flagellar brake domain-containing protein [Alkalihalophilus marmarensis]ERN54158.1 hypothetical protein A33I_06965 [Alkalihalophilus marmarensis DSM 21297]MCM3488421.1 flagellar brake domain-containing protein [Alkalihalophilus marmarensis]
MIEIGTTIQLETIEDSKDKESKKMRCRLVDKSKGLCIIDYPIDQKTEKTSFLIDGTKLKASFITEANVVYEFNTEVIGREKRNIPVLFLMDPGKDKYYRIQRRNYVRVEAANDVAVHSIDDAFKPFTSVTVDISGGGCAVLLPDEVVLSVDTQVDITIVLPMQKSENQYVRARCRVVRSYKPRIEAKTRASLQFIDVNQKDQDQIVRYCFERQVVLRRRNRD